MRMINRHVAGLFTIAEIKRPVIIVACFYKIPGLLQRYCNYVAILSDRLAAILFQVNS